MMKPLSEELKSRVMTFAFNIGYVALAAIADAALANLDILDLPQPYVVIFGLVLAQISKFAVNRSVTLDRVS